MVVAMVRRVEVPHVRRQRAARLDRAREHKPVFREPRSPPASVDLHPSLSFRFVVVRLLPDRELEGNRASPPTPTTRAWWAGWLLPSRFAVGFRFRPHLADARLLARIWSSAAPVSWP